MDVDDFLAHYGVKGQKWGVRRDPQTGVRPIARTLDRSKFGQKAHSNANKHDARVAKKLAKKDLKFEKAIASANKGRIPLELHNAFVTKLNTRVEALNDSDKYRNADLTTPSKIKTQYENDSHKLIIRTLEDATREHYGQNPSKTKRAVYNSKTDSIDLVDVAAAHAEGNSVIPNFSVKMILDSTGRFVDFEYISPSSEMSQEDAVADFLAHYGTKGMKWGVRTDGSVTSTTTKNSHLRRGEQNVTVKQRPGTFVKTSGGKRQTASSDAVKTAAARQVAKKSTTDALSTKQLEDAVKRMQVEQKFDKLAKQTDRRDRGRRFIESITGNKNVQAGSKHVAKKAAVMAAKVAAAA